MHFCIKCGNMYYIKIDDNDELLYNCRKCGHKNNTLINDLDNLCVSKTELTDNSIVDYSNIINRYTKLDPTLPRIDTIDCPNKDCPSNVDKDDDEEKKSGGAKKVKTEKEIIYIRYDDKNMKYLYLCAVCDHHWHNNK